MTKSNAFYYIAFQHILLGVRNGQTKTICASKLYRPYALYINGDWNPIWCGMAWWSDHATLPPLL